MGSPRVIYGPLPDTTPGNEAATLATVYRFILDAAAKETGGVPSTAENEKEIRDVPANHVLPQDR
jgi:hypothetical protein